MERLLQRFLKRLNNVSTLEELYKISRQVVKIDIFIDDADIISNRRVLLKNFLCSELMKKEELLTQNVDKTSYPSLNKIVSIKHCYANRIGKIIRKFPGIDRYLGNVPDAFLQNIPSSDKKKTAKSILKLFSEWSMKLNYDFEQDYDYNSENKCIDEAPLELEAFSSSLSKLIKQNVSAEFVGCGYNGNGFKITIGKKSFFYKVFYLYSKTEERSRYNRHGLAAEPQLALYSNKNSFKNTFARFYFGKVAFEHNIDSFIVSEYVSVREVYKEKKNLKINYLSISEKEMNKFDNTINGLIVDFGGIRINLPQLSDKKLRNVVRIILNHIIYKHDEMKFINDWEINLRNLESLKKYISKVDPELYKKALKIIKMQFKNLPSKLYKKLLNIDTLKEPLKITEQLQSSDIFQTDIKSIIRKINYFGLKIQTYQDADSIDNSFGYVIFKIGENKHVVVLFNSQNEVLQIRIEAVEDNKITVLKSVKGEAEITNFKEAFSLI